MTRYCRTTFVFSRELGSRLRELRQRRNLSLRDLALLMDRRGSGAYNQIGRLERGVVRYPSFNVVADYLRACGGGFRNLLDLLDSYTSQPAVVKARGDSRVAELLKALPKAEQRAMLLWEKGIVEAREARAAARPEKRKPRVETAEQRACRIIWSFIRANWNEVFEQKLYETMLRLKDAVPPSRRRAACRHSRRFFGVLVRRYRAEHRRQSALARLERRAAEDGFGPEAVAALLGAASEAYAELAGSGRLDWKPTEEELVAARGRAPIVTKAETRLELDAAGPRFAYNKAVGLICAMIQAAVGRKMEALRLDHCTVKWFYLRWLERLTHIAAEHGTDSPEWRAAVDGTAPRMHDEKFAREAAALAADTFNRWKVRLPPMPAGV